jgi:hypothetical protein
MQTTHISTGPSDVELRERASKLEELDVLLNALTDVLDIREVFDQVSKVAQRVLPHDLMGVMETNETYDRLHLHVVAGLAP